MASLVKVRGLARRGFRVGGQQITSAKVSVLNLDDGSTRRDFGHHASIGQLVSLGQTDSAVGRTGAVASAGTTTTVNVSAGTVYFDGGIPQAPVTSAAITALTNSAVVVDGTNPKYYLVSVPKTGGAAVLTAGTAAATPVVPAIPANSVPLATILIPAAAAAATAYTYTDVAPRL